MSIHEEDAGGADPAIPSVRRNVLDVSEVDRVSWEGELDIGFVRIVLAHLEYGTSLYIDKAARRRSSSII